MSSEELELCSIIFFEGRMGLFSNRMREQGAEHDEVGQGKRH
jgi:hypothetical protein